jgi:CBS domain-containing protein
MDQLEQKLWLLKPFLPKNQWEYLKLSHILEKDRLKKSQIEDMLDLLIAQNVPGLKMENILLPPPDLFNLPGDYPVGTVVYSDRPIGTFAVRKNEWLKHCGIFGKTGSGKTTLTIRILKQLCLNQNPFLIFDYKRNYRDLLKHPEFKNEDILIFTVGRNEGVPFYFNPKLKPEGVEEYVWIKQLTQIIEKVYILGPGATDVFMENSDYKTFKEMKESVLAQNKKARELLWWASAKRTLNAINYPGLGEMVNCLKGYSIPDLLKKKVILELDGLSNYDQAFVIGTLLLWIYHYRMREPEREVLKHFMVIEEAHHLFLKTNYDEDIADIIMREIRELGEAIIIIDQHPSKISVSALGNLSTKFALSLSLNQDVSALANAMLLAGEEKRYLAMLTVGQAVMRSDRFINPVLLNIPDFPVAKGVVTDNDIKTHMKPYLDDIRMEDPQCIHSTGIQSVYETETLSPLAKIMLENIAALPVSGLVRRFKTLGLKTGHGYKIINELVAKKHVIPVTVDGRRLYDVTVKGKKLLGKTWYFKGRGGLEHRYYIEKIKAHYIQNNCLAFLEKNDIDLVIEANNKTMAIQMETGKSDLQANLTKLGKSSANHKYMLATNKETELKIKLLLKDLLIPNRQDIQVRFAKDFLKSPPRL